VGFDFDGKKSWGNTGFCGREEKIMSAQILNELVILILQYNSADLTIELLHSIEKHEAVSKQSYRFVLMDNGSQDNKRSEIELLFPWIEFVEYGENLGFGRAHNHIMPSVVEPWVLLLNNDCILLNNAITCTLQEAQRLGADFATCAVKNEDLTDQVNFSTLPTPLRRVFLNVTGITRVLWVVRRWFKNVRVGYINGAFLLIKRESIPDGQLFDERYFMYTEDLDLMFRLAKQRSHGYRLSAGKVIHLGGRSAIRKWNNKEIDGAKELQAKECMQRHFPSWQLGLMDAIYKIANLHWLNKR
jgi:GT2 family glycosyltransferase